MTQYFKNLVKKAITFKKTPDECIKRMLIAKSVTDKQLLIFLMQANQIGFDRLYRMCQSQSFGKTYFCGKVLTLSALSVVYSAIYPETIFIVPSDYEINNFIESYEHRPKKFIEVE